MQNPMIGYDGQSKSNGLYHNESGQVIVRRDVIFFKRDSEVNEPNKLTNRSALPPKIDEVHVQRSRKDDGDDCDSVTNSARARTRMQVSVMQVRVDRILAIADRNRNHPRMQMSPKQQKRVTPIMQNCQQKPIIQ